MSITKKNKRLLDLFSLDNDKKSRKEYMPEIQDNSMITEESGVNRSMVGILPELWEQQQYDDEYDLESFLITLKNDIPSAKVHRN